MPKRPNGHRCAAMHEKSKLSRRITWHVYLILTIINVMVIGAVCLSCLEISKANAKMRAQHFIDEVDSKLVAMLLAVERTSNNNVTEIENHLDSPEAIFCALENELRQNPSYLGCAVAFEPDYYPSEGRWFEPYVLFRDSTTIERRQIGSAQHDYLNQEWYQNGIGLERGNGYLVDPYIDKDGAKQLVCSYVKPVFDSQNRKVGVYGIDIDLGWLDKATKKEEAVIKQRERVEDEFEKILNTFFIQVIDSKGEKVAGSESFDEETLQTIIKEDKIDFMKIELNDNSFFITSKRFSSTGWRLVVAQNLHFVYLSGYVIGFIILLLTTIGGIVIFFFLRRSIRLSVRPLRYLNESAKEVAQGNFDTLLPTFKRQDEITQLRDSFDTMQQSLVKYIADLEATTAKKAAMENEMKLAQKIQMSMIPQKFPPFPKRSDIDIFGSLTPAKLVGGDLFDFIIRNERLFFCIGDVSGKGMPAALMMTVIRFLFRSIAAHYDNPKQIVEIINNCFSADNNTMMFCTFFFGILDLKTGLLQYCNAGHEAPFILGRGKREVERMSVKPNIALGVMEGNTFQAEERQLQPEDLLFFYTDGLTDATNAEREMFDLERVKEALRQSVDNDLADAAAYVRWMADEVAAFVKDAPQADDLTLLAVGMRNEK